MVNNLVSDSRFIKVIGQMGLSTLVSRRRSRAHRTAVVVHRLFVARLLSLAIRAEAPEFHLG
jgi:hypothetical protein